MFVAELGLMCAKRAWPVWRAKFPSESRPIDLAESAISGITEGGTSVARFRGEFISVKTYLDNKFLLGPEYFSAIYAGFACWAVARDVLSGRHSGTVRGDNELEISPEEWDPCFMASLAVTGGAVWEGDQKPDIREFWVWYLTAAVPQAFGLAAASLF